VNASFGTRTRSAYSAVLDTPVLSNPDFRFQLGGLQSATQKIFASHEELLAGGFTKLRWLTKAGVHEVAYNGFRRTVTGLAKDASQTVRDGAGESFKSSLSHTWVRDTRDNPTMPSRGVYSKILSELAGFGPLRGDVAFFKGEVEQQTAIPIPIPGVKGDSGVSLTAGLRAGMLYPLTLSGQSNQLGGPTDVRGFRISGLGPHDGADAVGGDVYAAGGASLLFPLPRVGPDRPLRLQAFVNSGRLLALRGTKEGALSSEEVQSGMSRAISELSNGLPSTSAGIGLVYAHPAARFELNFSLPLVVRKGEDARKGVQFGIGINFL
jgi:outer membrane protein insertion porin family